MGLSQIVAGTLADFSRKTSIAGLNHAGRSTGSRFRFAYWLIIFAFGAVITAIGLVNVARDYLAYPVLTSNDLSHQNSIGFPAVTICNLNR